MVPLCKAHGCSTGKPCGKHAIKGGTVCHKHGGGAPQVKAAALARIGGLVPKATDRLEQLIDAPEGNVALSAVREVLNRAGVEPDKSVEMGGSNYRLDELLILWARARERGHDESRDIEAG